MATFYEGRAGREGSFEIFICIRVKNVFTQESIAKYYIRLDSFKTPLYAQAEVDGSRFNRFISASISLV